MAYSDPPLRNIVRLIVTSAYSIGSAPSVLSMVSATSARPRGGRPAVPAKMTSSILPPRSDLAPCSPMTQASASTTLDLPEPLGPTMHVMPGLELQRGRGGEGLEPAKGQALQVHVGSSRCHTRSCGAAATAGPGRVGSTTAPYGRSDACTVRGKPARQPGHPIVGDPRNRGPATPAPTAGRPRADVGQT